MKKEIKLKFQYYHKFEFFFLDEDNKQWHAGGDSGDIYRFWVDLENTAIWNEEEKMYILDGYPVTKYE